MKLKTSKLHRHNMKIQISNDVALKFDSEGIVEVPEGINLEDLLLRDPSLSIIEEASKELVDLDLDEEDLDKLKVTLPKVGEPITEKLVEVPAKVGEENILTNEEVESKFTGIEDLKVPELQELCKEANLPKKEWSDLNKEPLIEYIKSNIEG